MEDPYFIVKADVERALNNLSNLYDSYQKLANNSSPTNGLKEVNDVRGEIKTALRDVQYDIEDIEETVRIVEANPKKFKITPAEVESRKQFISISKDKLQSIESAIRNTKSPNKIARDQAGKKKNAGSKGTVKSANGSVKYSKLESFHDEENDKFITGAMNEQQQLLHRQDEEVSFLSFL